jgi:hypothetical protein
LLGAACVPLAGPLAGPGGRCTVVVRRGELAAVVGWRRWRTTVGVCLDAVDGDRPRCFSRWAPGLRATRRGARGGAGVLGAGELAGGGGGAAAGAVVAGAGAGAAGPGPGGAAVGLSTGAGGAFGASPAADVALAGASRSAAIVAIEQARIARGLCRRAWLRGGMAGACGGWLGYRPLSIGPGRLLAAPIQVGRRHNLGARPLPPHFCTPAGVPEAPTKRALPTTKRLPVGDPGLEPRPGPVLRSPTARERP